MSADRPLRTEADHATALAEIRRLWNSPVGTPEGDQLDLLLVLVDAYEAEHFSIDPPDPIEAIEERMKGTRE